MKQHFFMTYVCVGLFPWLDDIFFERFEIVGMTWAGIFTDGCVIALMMVLIQIFVRYLYNGFEECIYVICEKFKIYPECMTMRRIELIICSVMILWLGLCVNLIKLAVYFQFFKEFIYIVK